MQPRLILAAVLFCHPDPLPAAETPAPTNAPSGRRSPGPPPVRSPEIEADRRVTFRLRAPKATEVILSGQWSNQPVALAKSTNDVWSATVGPIDPGVWEYNFQVDGLGMIDPGNPNIKPMREPRTSILHIAGLPLRLTDFQDVPHGVVHQHTYRSKSLARIRDLVVYTPPSYDTRARASFPVLYLQHGSGDNQATWTTHGKAHWIVDNLIAQGRAKPMIIVMMDGHAVAPGGADSFGKNTEAFERDLLEDVIPFVESAYRVKTEFTSRAIVGLSMGGGQSLTVGLRHRDRFAWVGGFSSAPPNTNVVSEAFNSGGDTKRKLKLLWIGCGREDFLLKRNEDFIALLKERQIPHEWHLTEGAHTWPLWRSYLADFVPRLFQ